MLPNIPSQDVVRLVSEAHRTELGGHDCRNVLEAGDCGEQFAGDFRVGLVEAPFLLGQRIARPPL